MTLHATIVPDGTITAGAWTIGGGAGSLHAALADASDATFAQSNAVNDSLVVSLGNIPALGVGEYITHIRVVFRTSAGSPFGGNATIWVIVPSGRNQGNSAGPLSSVIGDAVLTTTGIDGPWTEAQVNGLTIACSGSASATTFFHRLYVEVFTNSPPTATPLLTDPIVISTVAGPGEPFRNWNYSDPDGDAQESVHVKLFAGGDVVADPETEVARVLSDTGEINYAGTIIGFNTWPNGDYVWAVKAKDVGGTFGPWGQRIITFDLPVPEPPLLSAVPDVPNNRYALAVDDVAGANPTEFFQIQRSETSGVLYGLLHDGTMLPFSGFPVVLYDYRSPRMARAHTPATIAPLGYNEALGYNAPVGYNGEILTAESGPANVVRYRARAGRIFNGVTIWSAWTTITPASLVGDGTTWLKHPFDPTRSIQLQQVANWETSQEEDMGILRAAGRRDFVVFAGVSSHKRGELELIFSSDAAFDAFEALRFPRESNPATALTAGSMPLVSPTTYLFQSCFGDTILEQVWMRLGPTLSVTRVTTGPQQHTNQYRRVKIGFVETNIPTS